MYKDILVRFRGFLNRGIFSQQAEGVKRAGIQTRPDLEMVLRQHLNRRVLPRSRRSKLDQT